MDNSISTKKSPIKRRSAQDSKAMDKRNAILDAALVEFAELGFEGTSARRIGKRANVDFTLITYYFKTKENLWLEVISRGYEKLKQQYQQIESLSLNNLTAAQSLKIKLESGFRFVCDNPEIFRIMQVAFQGNNDRVDWQNIGSLAELYQSQIDDLIQAQADGDVVSGDPRLLFNMMVIAIRTLLFSEGALQHTLGRDPRDPELIKEFLQLFDRVFFKNTEKN
ncbi:regulatory protein TetR [Marinomonas mediterranea MMB-1]|uniref:Regulatory protein TetR n=2 Tax=Marinomonas mediterranea TaxID=119864 RepID=F2K382_MARM1|nr:regulatory protein TetR [Marinomonas mediterranea MMB-1]